MSKDQFVKTLTNYLLAHGYARWESWDINYEWERYQRGRSWSNEFFALCPECGEEGPHYIPASFGMAGFWTCAKFYGEDGRRLS